MTSVGFILKVLNTGRQLSSNGPDIRKQWGRGKAVAKIPLRALRSDVADAS
jgi:hypothetical protein